MGIVITQLCQSESQDDRHRGQVSHNGHLVEATIVGAFARLLDLIQKPVTAEYDLDEIVSAEINLEKDDQSSGFFPTGDGNVTVDGTVFNEVVVDERLSLFDVYLQNRADFICISSDQLPGRPNCGTRIRITGNGFIVYPTFL